MKPCVCVDFLEVNILLTSRVKDGLKKDKYTCNLAIHKIQSVKNSSQMWCPHL
jgi:hypothetical protein